MNERAVELGQAVEVELLEGLVGAEAGAAHAEGELLLLAPGDLGWPQFRGQSVVCDFL
jgi:hypothetical protein